MKVTLRITGALAVLVVTLALMPAIAMAAPTIAQGINGTVMDSSTGVPIPFSPVIVQVNGGASVFIKCGYDGTYSYATPVSAEITVTAGDIFHVMETVGPIAVTAGAVTTQNFTIDRSPVYEQPIYRFFNVLAGVHFYSADDAEFIGVYKNMQHIYKYDGIAYRVPWGNPDLPSLINPNTFPLYRFYNTNTGVHFYTMSEQEKADVMATRGDDYVFEGIAYRVSDRAMDLNVGVILGFGSGFPVHRFYLPSKDAHFFTADSGEVFFPFFKLSNVYQYEGVGFYINSWRSVETDTLPE